MLGIFVSGCFFAIYRLSLFSCQGTLPHRGGVKFCLYSITVPLCIAAAALVPPARPAGYGQPAFECSVIRFPASPVPCGLSFCRFRWLLPLLPTFDFLPKGLLSWPCVLFQLAGEVLHLWEPLFQHGKGFLFLLPSVDRIDTVQRGFNGLRLFGEVDRLLE